MEKIRLGRTNLIVTKLGWGGIPIQRAKEAQAVSVLQAIVDLGVDLLDTARGYTTSERKVGMALKRMEGQSSFLRSLRFEPIRSMIKFTKASASCR